MSPVFPPWSVGFPQLTARAGRLYGARSAILEMETPGPAKISYAELSTAVEAFAARARGCGLTRGERVLILGAARIGVAIALLGALLANLEPVLAPAHFSSEDLSSLSRAANAAALFSPLLYGELNLKNLLLETCAFAPSLRLIGSLGPGRCEEMEDFVYPFPAAERQGFFGDASVSPRIGFLAHPFAGSQKIVFVEQQRLLNYAREASGLLRAEEESAVISLVSFASLAGVAFGPALALRSGASLTLCAPFRAENFLNALEEHPASHVIAPESASQHFAASGLLESGVLASLTLTRHNQTRARNWLAASCPVLTVSQLEDGALIFSQQPAAASFAQNPNDVDYN